MRKLAFFAIFSIFSIYIPAYASNANNSTNTINDCTKFLPAGNDYAISITGNINKTSHNRDQKLKGNFNVIVKDNNGNMIAEEKANSASKSFVECVSKLIK